METENNNDLEYSSYYNLNNELCLIVINQICKQAKINYLQWGAHSPKHKIKAGQKGGKEWE